MENYADSMELYENSLNAAGTSTQKFAIWQESTQAKVEKFTASMQDLYSSFIQTETVKGFIDLGTRVIEVINVIVDKFGLLPPIIFIVVVSFSLLNGAVKAFLFNLQLSIIDIAKTIAGMYGLKTVTTGVTAATTGATAATTGFSAALKTLPLMAIITGLSMVVGYLIELGINSIKSKEGVDSLSNSLKKVYQAESDLAKIKDLNKEYTDLKQKLLLNDEERNRLVAVQNELVQLLPSLAEGFDAEGNAIITNSIALKENIELKERQLELEREKAGRSFVVDSKDAHDDLLKKNADLEKSRDKYKELQDKWEKQRIATEEAKKKYNEAYAQNADFDTLFPLETDLLKSENAMIKLDKQMNKLKETIIKQQQESAVLIEKKKEGAIAVLEEEAAYKKLNTAIKSDLINKATSDNVELTNFISLLKEDKELPKRLFDVQKSLSDIQFGKSDDLKKASENFQKARDSLIEFAKTQEEYKDAPEEFADAILNMSITTEHEIAKLKVSIYSFESAMKDVKAGSVNAIGGIQSAFMALGISINNDVAGILLNYLDLIMGIESVADAYDALGQAIRNDVEAYDLNQGLAAYSKTLELEKTFVAVGSAKERLADLINVNNNHAPDSSSSGSGDTYTTDLYAKALAELNAQLEVLDFQKSHLVETSDEYLEIMKKEIEIHQQIQELAHAEAELIRKQIAAGALGQKEIDDAEDKILKLQDTWRDAQKSINDLSFEIAESSMKKLDNEINILKTDIGLLQSEHSALVVGSEEYASVLNDITLKNIELIKSYREKEAIIRKELENENLSIKQKYELAEALREVINAQKELKIQITQQLNTLADDIINTYKKIYEEQKDLALEGYEKQIKAEDERHNAVMDNLDKELDAYEKLIRAKLDMLDKMDSERDYNKDLNKLQKERQDIQNRLNALALDTSQWSLSQQEDLRKQLADKDMAIEDLQYDYNLQLRKDNLNDMLDKFKEEIDAKKEAEKRKYDLTKKYLDEAKKQQEKYYDDLINQEERWAAMKLDIMTSNLNELEGKFDVFANFLKGNLSVIGTSIYTNLVLQMESALRLLDAYNNSGGIGIGNVNSNGHYDSNLGYYVGGTGQSDYDRTGQAIRYYHDNDMIDKLNSAIEYAIKMGYRYTTLHDGGVVGGTTDRMTDIANKLFNLKPNEQIVKALKGELYIPQNNIPNFFNNLRGLFSSAQPAMAGVQNFYQLDISIANMSGSKKDIDYMFSEINKGIRKIGK